MELKRTKESAWICSRGSARQFPRALYVTSLSYSRFRHGKVLTPWAAHQPVRLKTSGLILSVHWRHANSPPVGGHLGLGKTTGSATKQKTFSFALLGSLGGARSAKKKRFFQNSKEPPLGGWG